MSNREFLFCLVGPIALGASIASGGTILHVDDDAPPAGDGLSWAGAYDSLQEALADAAGGGFSEIRVAQGVYKPAGMSDCCTPSGGLGCDVAVCQDLVCKVFPPCCVNGWDALCADLAQDLCTVCSRDETFQLLNGVVLAGGYAGIGEPNPDDRDVALYETILSGDVTGNDGPGAFDNNADNSYHVVTGSGTDQTAVIDGFTITGGNADFGGVDGNGGGMLNSNGSPTVTSCTFSANTAVFGGGGMFNFPGNPMVGNCTFSGNTADAGGGMFNVDSHPTVTNCTFIANSVSDGGGGMANFSSSSPTVTNCTFSGNLGGPFGGAGMINAGISSNPTLRNCVLWGDIPDEIFDEPGSAATVLYSDVQGGFPGAGNSNANPMFVDPVNGDVRLKAGSPCIDAGDNTAVPVGVTTDLDGNPRLADDLATTDMGNGECPVVDMGSYEFPTSCPSDLDCDANVGITDFLALLAAWGTDPGGPPDLDGDGNVGINDFLELLANWGPCP